MNSFIYSVCLWCNEEFINTACNKYEIRFSVTHNKLIYCSSVRTCWPVRPFELPELILRLLFVLMHHLHLLCNKSDVVTYSFTYFSIYSSRVSFVSDHQCYIRQKVSVTVLNDSLSVQTFKASCEEMSDSSTVMTTHCRLLQTHDCAAQSVRGSNSVHFYLYNTKWKTVWITFPLMNEMIISKLPFVFTLVINA